MVERIRIWIFQNKVLCAIVLFTIFLLVYKVSDRTFWMDETAVLEYFKYSVPEFIRQYWIRPDNHPPLYYLLVLLINKMLPETESSVRLVSMLAGLGLVIMTYYFTVRVSAHKTTALIAAFFTAYSSYFVLIAQMARYHSLSALSSLIALYLFYRLTFEKFSQGIFVGYVSVLIVIAYTDYPHFIYVAFVTNAVYLITLLRRQALVRLRTWIVGQIVAACVCLPLIGMLYNRIVVQGDGGWSDINLLGNSWVHIMSGIVFHVYSFFFGENIFPWNVLPVLIGLIVLSACLFGFIKGIRLKTFRPAHWYIFGLSVVLIVMNTVFMNVADRRYNFIVYPKFGFVAYPLWIMSFVICLSQIASKKIRISLFIVWCIVACIGLRNFYTRTNYLNGSYFNTFSSMEYLRDHSHSGDRLAITPDAGEGSYLFYKNAYFSAVEPLFWADFQTAAVPAKTRVWFFSTGADGPESTVTPDANIPSGFRVIESRNTVPLDPTLKKYKEIILHRPSYTYKYTLFLLEKV